MRWRTPKDGSNLLPLPRQKARGQQVQLPNVIARIFQENITYQPAKMDYKTFLDLALALECREHIQSLRVSAGPPGLLVLLSDG